MSNSKGIRLWLRPAEASGRAASWVIRDGSKQIRTGCAASDVVGANEALAKYLNKNHRTERDGRDLSDIPVSDVLLNYARSKFGPDIKQEPRVAGDNPISKSKSRVRKLVAFFGEMMLGEITNETCAAYVKFRMSEFSKSEKERVKGKKTEPRQATPSAARRELEDLRAAINLFLGDDILRPKVNIQLPEKSEPKQDWMTVPEAAHFLRTAWRRTQRMPHGEARLVSRHIARFTLVGLYSGTRAAAICGAAIRPTVGRGYVDLERGVFYRRAPGTKDSSKRQPFVRLPRKLINHIRRWARLGLCENCIVEWQGEPVKRVSKGFRAVAVAAGLPHVTPHVLRHTSISWALQSGAKRFDVSGYYGVSEKVIERTYGHHDPNQHIEVTSRMDRRNVR